jgi:Uma2 family endonuclease
VATTPTRVMTVEEFDRIPNPPGGVYELYHGELVKMAFPELPHARGQRVPLFFDGEIAVDHIFE